MDTPVLTVELSVGGELWDTVRAIAPLASWQLWVSSWLTQLSPTLSPIQAYELSVQFTSDERITVLNARYRQFEQPTDVLSFATSDHPPLPMEIVASSPWNLGDIIISVETAQKQCGMHGHTLLEELAWLATHGLLHLLGWDHPDEAHLQQMLLMQQTLLSQIGVKLDSSVYSIAESPRLPVL